jgi:hypothetical protein
MSAISYDKNKNCDKHLTSLIYEVEMPQLYNIKDVPFLVKKLNKILLLIIIATV